MSKQKKRLIKKKKNATWQQKFQMELGRNRELTMNIGKYEKAVEQTRMLVDSILIRAAVEYGKESDGSYRMELPEKTIAEVLNEYSLGTIKEGEKLVLHVTKK